MKSIAVLVLALSAVGCDRADPVGSERDEEKDTRSSADNTERNDRDRDMDTLTPEDQGQSEADRTITQRIRQDVIENDDLSTVAANVKIITVDGVVTLRGPVESAQEQSTIGAIAQRVDGVRRVDNQLEIASR